MSRPGHRPRWQGALIFCVFAFCLVIFALIPVGLSADAQGTPDLLPALIFAWMVRSPESLPVSILVLVALFSDLMLSQPVGLRALLLLIGGVYVGHVGRTIIEQMFVVEWAGFALAFGVMLGIEALVLQLSFAPVPALGLMLWHWLASGLAYPLIAGILHFGLKVRAPRLAPARPKGSL